MSYSIKAFNISGSPSGGIWSGSHITNSNLGTFNPSVGLGQTIVTYSLDGAMILLFIML